MDLRQAWDWLTAYTPFMDRWHCIRGDAALGYWLLWANGITWAVYWGMSVPLVKVYRAHRQNVGAAWLLAGSAAFIALCGTHHALYILAFRYPCYRMMAANDVLMAIVSTVVCLAFYAKADMLCLMRPASAVEAERDAKDSAMAELREAQRALSEQNVRLANMVNDYRADLEVYQSHYGRDRAHRDMMGMIDRLDGEFTEMTSRAAPPPAGKPAGEGVSHGDH